MAASRAFSPEWPKGGSFGQINVEAERSRDGARNLRNLHGVGEPVAEVVAVTAGEDLSLGLETAEGTGMNDPIAVALKVVAVGMVGLNEPAAAGMLDVHRVTRQHGWSVSKAASCPFGPATERSRAGEVSSGPRRIRAPRARD